MRSTHARETRHVVPLHGVRQMVSAVAFGLHAHAQGILLDLFLAPLARGAATLRILNAELEGGHGEPKWGRRLAAETWRQKPEPNHRPTPVDSLWELFLTAKSYVFHSNLYG